MERRIAVLWEGSIGGEGAEPLEGEWSLEWTGQLKGEGPLIGDGSGTSSSFSLETSSLDITRDKSFPRVSRWSLDNRF